MKNMNTEKAAATPYSWLTFDELVGLGDHQFGAAERVRHRS